jgi:transcriptional regulator with XRE-family HTH domain
MTGIGRAHLSQIENGAAAARITTLYAIAQTHEIKTRRAFQGILSAKSFRTTCHRRLSFRSQIENPSF